MLPSNGEVSMCSTNCDNVGTSYGRYCFEDASCPDHPAIAKRRRFKRHSKSYSSSEIKIVSNFNGKHDQNTVLIKSQSSNSASSESTIQTVETSADESNSSTDKE